MIFLWISTFIWAFSFPIIGYFITNQIDNYLAIFIRTFIAFLVFLPFINLKIKNKLKLQLMLIGALQIGIMYIFYYNSFYFLSVSEVALFTIFTPFYVSLFYDLFSKKFRFLNLISIAISVVGAFVIKQGEISNDFLKGFFLIQIANIVFAAAQSLYKYISMKENIINHSEHFAYFFLGASLVSFLGLIFLGNFTIPKTNSTYFALIYLGLIASSIGYFLWNVGATKVDSGMLALMNNAIIPIAIIANLVFFKIDINIIKFIFGSILMIFAIFLHQKLLKSSLKRLD